MSNDSDTDGNSMIPSSQGNSEAGLPSHRGDWMKIQQSAKDVGNVPPMAVPGKAVAKPPKNISSDSRPKNSSGESNDRFISFELILMVLGFVFLMYLFGLILAAMGVTLSPNVFEDTGGY